MEGKLKKTDRRTLYTKMVIKDALLELLATNDFEKITVTAACKQAEVSRATFYLHFDDLTAVLDECLADALKIADAAGGNPNTDMLKMLHMIASGEFDTEMLQANDTLLPACQRAADLPKYSPLFLIVDYRTISSRNCFRQRRKGLCRSLWSIAVCLRLKRRCCSLL